MKNILIVIVSFIFTLTLFYYNSVPAISKVYSDYTAVRRYGSSVGLFSKGEASKYFFNKKGESYVFDGDSFNVQAFLEDYGATTVKKEVLPETEIIYAFTDQIKVYNWVFNNKVNLHIAIANGRIKVGIPFIYDSF